MAATDLVVALTGASGAPYGVRLLEVLLARPDRPPTVSPAAVEVWSANWTCRVRLDASTPPTCSAGRRPTSRQDPLPPLPATSGPASPAGSFLTAGMVICPCSMGTVAAIAHGLSQNLDPPCRRRASTRSGASWCWCRARRRWAWCRLRNLLPVAEAGAVVLPAMPAFYTRPATLADMIDFVVGRVCDQFGVEHDL